MTLKTLFALGAATLALAATPALAGEAGTAAQAHLDAIVKGDVAAITAVYGEDATLHWVGGPLDGTYKGAGLTDVWTKFTTAQGPLTSKVLSVTEQANPAGGTVTTDVIFQGKAAVPVHYVMVFRGGALVDEIWQVAPGLAK
jgi:ketosteroid isomerase-like protein